MQSMSTKGRARFSNKEMASDFSETGARSTPSTRLEIMERTRELSRSATHRELERSME